MCSVGDLHFPRVPEAEQLLVVPFIMKSLRMYGWKWSCTVEELHTEDEVVAEIHTS